MKKRVLIAVNTAGPAGQGKLAGILRYLSGRPNWSLTIARHPTAFTPALVNKAIADSCDGFIISTGEADEAMRIVANQNIPTITLDINDNNLWRHHPNVFRIRNSGDYIGKIGADYLISTGRCRSYAYIHFHLDNHTYDWDARRFRAFQKRITEKGLACHDIHLLKDILNLPRPVGILAANDEIAFSTIQYCKEHRIRVPESALIIGVDNDPLICENCTPQITSIQSDFESEGILAAETLDRMMRGDWKPTKQQSEIVLSGTQKVIQRGSTATTSLAGKMVQKAVAYIQANALKGINVNDVVRVLGCSRRLADMRFRELQNISINEMIINFKLDEAKKRLRSTNDSIVSIAEACGYSNVTHLKTLFKRRFSISMKDYRNTSR